MPLPDIDTALDWRGRNVIDRNGEKIGKFDELYLDEETSRPEWAAVTTGLFGRKQTLIPLSQARLEGDDLQVPFDQEHVKDAPALDPDEQVSQEEERQLYSHYGIDHSSSGSDTVLPEQGREGAAEREATGGQAVGGPTAGGETTRGQPTGTEATGGEPTGGETTRGQATGADPAGGTASGEAIAAEETTGGGTEDAASGAPGSDERAGADERSRAAGEGGLYVGTEARPRERVRLKKYVVTEEVTKKVPVTREEVRLEREPVGEGEEGAGQIAEGEDQIVLSEEEPVVEGPDQTRDQREER